MKNKSYEYVDEWNREFTYSGREDKNTALRLKDGETCKVTGVGNSMIPKLYSRQPVICIPVKDDTNLSEYDIVLCKVHGSYLLHQITSIENSKGDCLYMISNNHGRNNGKIPRSQIFGLVVEILTKYNTNKSQQRNKNKKR